MWPFLGLYGLWLWREGDRVAPALGFAVVAFGWLLPDALGTDGLFAAGSTARKTASEGSAQLAAVPFLAVLWDAVDQLGIAAVPLAVAALVPWRRADPALRALALAGAAYVLIVAVSAQAGFAGNPRYLVPAEALFCVLAGAGAARVPRPLAVALAGRAGGLLGRAHPARPGLDRLARRAAAEARRRDRARGRRCGRSRRCGNVQSGFYWRALVSSRLHADIASLDLPRDPTRVLVRAPAEEGGPYEPARVPRGLTRRVALPDWEIWTACRLSPLV